MRAFGEIIEKVVRSRRDLNEEEIRIVKEELDAKSSMILMIFRFFLQSSEYSFFIRRLKNAVMTKVSFKQLAVTSHQYEPQSLLSPSLKERARMYGESNYQRSSSSEYK